MLNAGVVQVVYGSASGLTTLGDAIYQEADAAIPDVPESTEAFGWSLAAADFDGDGDDDLAIGVPNEWTGTSFGTGAVVVLAGDPAGLGGAAVFDQDSPDVPGGAETGDGFGNALAAGDFDDDGFADLAVGVAHEEVDGQTQAGAVEILYGTAGGLATARAAMFHQDVAGMLGMSEADDQFGKSLVALRGLAEGPLFGDDFETAAPGRWSGVAP